MAIKCGNCHGQHDTIREVRECHGEKASQGPTERQVSYLRSLASERTDHGITDVESLISTLNRETASNLIDQLLRKPKVDKGSLPADIVGEIPQHGTFTVGFKDDSRTTIRIRKPHPQANFVVAEYLFGPDNETSFKRFAREAVGGFRINPGLSPDGRAMQALRALVSATDAEKEEMGFQYALESGNCWRCGRKLTVPASITRGLGPRCAGLVA